MRDVVYFAKPAHRPAPFFLKSDHPDSKQQPGTPQQSIAVRSGRPVMKTSGNITTNGYNPATSGIKRKALCQRPARNTWIPVITIPMPVSKAPNGRNNLVFI